MGNFFDKDRGWKEFMYDMKKNSGETAVFAGYLRSSGEYKPKAGHQPSLPGLGGSTEAAPITMAQLAAVHEFGSPNQGIPERSFMRSGMSEINKQLIRMCKTASLQVALGRTDKKKALGRIVEFLVTTFKNKIQEGIPPPNTPETIKRKGSSHTLIDTGQLRDTIDWEIKEGKDD